MDKIWVEGIENKGGIQASRREGIYYVNNNLS